MVLLDDMREVFVVTEGDIKELAEKVFSIVRADSTPSAKVLFLEGELGSGKTTFTKEFAELLGIPKEDVMSPTFILKKEYPAHSPHFRKLIHVDAYRFATPEEGKFLRLEEDAQNPNTVLAIEWPARLRGIRPQMRIMFETVDDTTREVTLIYGEDAHD
jgi:tRNA threonylcarbamoyladenosine biosynthesis protein TsaE